MSESQAHTIDLSLVQTCYGAICCPTCDEHCNRIAARAMWRANAVSFGLCMLLFFSIAALVLVH